MTTVRVYLSTYRRNHLLRRALDSLLNQTFGDWVCELHNDDPADRFPEELVRRVGDARIALVNHEVNYGPTRSFNGFFKPIRETYFSILEDDNWWEPEFLQRMVAALEAQTTIQLAWANMRRWIEEPDGSWTDTGIDVWDRPPGAAPELFYWPHPQHVLGALHSQGAILARSGDYTPVPNDVNSAAMESFRERTLRFPILFVPQRLANFAVTMVSSRPLSRASWTQTLALLAGSFAEIVPMKPESMDELWQRAWGSGKTKSTAVLIMTGFAFPGARKLLRNARLRDWLFFMAYYAKHPVELARTLRLLRGSDGQREFLLKHTRARLREAQEHGLTAF
jgi:glycosyltransferase involved in cell wall biosynthesis